MSSTADAMRARTILGLLLFTDALFISLHLLSIVRPHWLAGHNFPMEVERGFAEAFQYLKTGCIALCFLWLSVRTSERAYLVWLLVFGYLLLDDSMALHETAGTALAQFFGLPYRFGLRPEDFGEIAVFLLSGTMSLLLVGIAYHRGSTGFRRSARLVVAMLAMFTFFAAIVDMLHIMAFQVGDGWLLAMLIGTLEDGGEMLVMSAICTYTIVLLLRQTRDMPGDH